MSKKIKIEIRQSEDMQQIDDDLAAALKALEDANGKVSEVLEIEQGQRPPAPLFTGVPEGGPAESSDAATAASASGDSAPSGAPSAS